MLLDFRHALRTIWRSPAASGAAVLTMALTLGVGASIFAIVDAVLLTPPPFADPDALVIAGEVPSQATATVPRAVRYATLETWRSRTASLASLEALDDTFLTLTGLGAAERVRAT